MNKEEALQWLSENKNCIINNVSFTNEKLKELFEVNNLLTPVYKDFTTCGTCVLDVKKRLRVVLQDM